MHKPDVQEYFHVNNYGTKPLLHSHKSSKVLPGVLPNQQKLYKGSDLDQFKIFNIKA